MPTAIDVLERFPLAMRALESVLLALAIYVLVRLVRNAVTRRIADHTVRHQVRKGIGTAGWVLTIVAAAAMFSDKLGGLALSFGVAGAGVAFALQEIIASMAGRVAILFGGFYDTGDRVQLGGIKGDVIDIGLLRTTIMEVGDWVRGDLFTGRVVRVANSFIFKEPVFNYSGDFGFLWDEVTVPIKYGCDHREARRVLEAIADEVTGDFAADARGEWKQMLDKYSVENARVEPMVTLIANDNWMEFTVRYVVPFTRRRGTKDVLFTRVLDAVAESKGRLALASATFHLVEAPRLSIDVTPTRSDHDPLA